MRIGRREFIALVAASPALARLEVRSAEVETVFDSPGPKPNGLQATTEGLWILDQGDNCAYLVDYVSGNTIRKLETETKLGSGITFDGAALWTASTYSREILQIDAHDGKPCDGWTRRVPESWRGPPRGAAPWHRRPRRLPSRNPELRGTPPARTEWSGATGSCGLRFRRRSGSIASIPDRSGSRSNSPRQATGLTALVGKAGGCGARSPTTTRSTASTPKRAVLTSRSSWRTLTRCHME